MSLLKSVGGRIAVFVLGHVVVLGLVAALTFSPSRADAPRAASVTSTLAEPLVTGSIRP